MKEVIGSFTTDHPCCAPRVTNIHRIADLVDGHVLLPGERFDLNALTGPRDRARGFVDAPQILDGEFVDRIGGGISQFVTTMFNAVFFSGLKDVEHSPHSYYISRYPPGREATISDPAPDFVFENDSPHGVLIDTSYTDTLDHRDVLGHPALRRGPLGHRPAHPPARLRHPVRPARRLHRHLRRAGLRHRRHARVRLGRPGRAPRAVPHPLPARARVHLRRAEPPPLGYLPDARAVLRRLSAASTALEVLWMATRSGEADQQRTAASCAATRAAS